MRGSPDGATRQSGPPHSARAPRGQSDAQARRIRSIGFLEASRGFKEASKNLQEASWRLQETSKRHPRGFKRLQEASKRLQEASKRLQEASRGLKRLQEAFKSKSDAQARRIRGIGPFLLQIHCVLQSLFDGASNPLCFRGDGGATVQPGSNCPPTRERLQEANLTHRREGLEA